MAGARRDASRTGAARRDRGGCSDHEDGQGNRADRARVEGRPRGGGRRPDEGRRGRRPRALRHEEWRDLSGAVTACTSPTGNVSRASQPRPSVRLARASLPPCASAIWRESARPIPLPRDHIGFFFSLHQFSDFALLALRIALGAVLLTHGLGERNLWSTQPSAQMPAGMLRNLRILEGARGSIAIVHRSALAGHPCRAESPCGALYQPACSSHSGAMNPEARCRAGRPCLRGSKSRNRLSALLAWPVSLCSLTGAPYAKSLARPRCSIRSRPVATVWERPGW